MFVTMTMDLRQHENVDIRSCGISEGKSSMVDDIVSRASATEKMSGSFSVDAANAAIDDLKTSIAIRSFVEEEGKTDDDAPTCPNGMFTMRQDPLADDGSVISDLTGCAVQDCQSNFIGYTGDSPNALPSSSPSSPASEASNRHESGVPLRVSVPLSESSTERRQKSAPCAPGEFRDTSGSRSNRDALEKKSYAPSAHVNHKERVSNLPEEDNSGSSSSVVTFGRVHIRLYERILCDNPAVTSGPPLGIGWKYKAYKRSFVVDEWEQLRASGRRNCNEMIMPRTDREALLYKLGYTRHDIASSVRTILRIKTQRLQTVNNLDAQQFEEFVESTCRSIKRVLLFQACFKKDMPSW